MYLKISKNEIQGIKVLLGLEATDWSIEALGAIYMHLYENTPVIYFYYNGGAPIGVTAYKLDKVQTIIPFVSKKEYKELLTESYKMVSNKMDAIRSPYGFVSTISPVNRISFLESKFIPVDKEGVFLIFDETTEVYFIPFYLNRPAFSDFLLSFTMDIAQVVADLGYPMQYLLVNDNLVQYENKLKYKDVLSLDSYKIRLI